MAATLVEQPRKTKNGKITKHNFLFTDGNPVAGISAQAILTDVSGVLTGVRVKFSAVTVPNTMTITITDADGITLAAGTLTANGIISITDPPQAISEGMKVTISGNTTAGGIANLIFYIIKM